MKTQQSFSFEASRQRICATYRGEPTDRTPIMPPIEWTPDMDIDAKPPDDWRDEKNFMRVARLVQKHCDVDRRFSEVGFPSTFERISYQRFLEAPAEYVEELPTEKVSDNRTRHTFVLHTPKGDLYYVYEEEKGIFASAPRKAEGPSDHLSR